MSKFWTPLCDRFEIDVPIFGFAHDMDTVAAISNAGGYGVYGATRRFPQEITDELAYSLAADKKPGSSLRLRTGIPVTIPSLASPSQLKLSFIPARGV